MIANRRPGLGREAHTLPARYYTDPGLFRREMEHIFFARHLHVGRTEHVAEPGDFLTIEFAGESFVLLRDGEGKLHAHYNVCRHRGTRLCTEGRGTLPGQRLRCPYHAWTYSADGRLTNAPYMEKTEGFSKDDHSLAPAAVDTWDGHLFLHPSPPASPLAEQLDDLPETFRAWGMADLRSVHRTVYSLAANWKLILQNYSECLHCPLLHPQLQAVSHYMSGENAPPHPSYLGGRMELDPGCTTLVTDGKSPWQLLPGLSPTEQRGVYYYAILPNLLLNLHPDYMLTFTLLPRAADRTDIVCEWHFHPDEIAKPGFDPTPAVEFWDLTNRQDWQVSEWAQEGIASRSYRPGPYSNREELLYALDLWVLEQLGDEAS